MIVLRSSASDKDESASSSVPPDVFCQNLKKLEAERNKLKRQLHSKLDEIGEELL